MICVLGFFISWDRKINKYLSNLLINIKLIRLPDAADTTFNGFLKYEFHFKIITTIVECTQLQILSQTGANSDKAIDWTYLL